MPPRLLAYLALLLSGVWLLPPAARAASILGTAFNGGFSHELAVLKVGEELFRRGHTFTMLLTTTEEVSHDLIKHKAFPGLKLEYIDGMPGYKTPAQMTDNDPGLVHDVGRLVVVLADVMYQTAIAMHNDTAAIERLRGNAYDLMLRDVGFWPAAVVQHQLGIPAAVGLWPMGVLPPMSTDYLQMTSSMPSYIPQFPIMAAPAHPQSFVWRLKNLLAMHFINFAIKPVFDAPIGRFLKDTGYLVPELVKRKPSTAAVIVTNDWSALSTPTHLPPRIHMVGPVIIEPPSGKCDADIDEFLTATGLPAIYVSMGTSVILAKSELHSVVAGLSGLKSPVLWKLGRWDLPGNLTLADLQLGANIKRVEFVKQIDILAHPSVKVFITQGGIQSMQETMTHGVTPLVIPLGGDQPHNGAQAAAHGFGLKLDPKHLDPSGAVVRSHVQRLLTEPSFQENADKIARRMWRPHSARAAAADVVERVLHTGGDMYLTSPQQDLSWIQLNMVDVYAVLFSGAAAVLALLGWLLWGLAVRMRRWLGFGRSVKAKAA